MSAETIADRRAPLSWPDLVLEFEGGDPNSVDTDEDGGLLWEQTPPRSALCERRERPIRRLDRTGLALWCLWGIACLLVGWALARLAG